MASTSAGAHVALAGHVGLRRLRASCTPPPLDSWVRLRAIEDRAVVILRQPLTPPISLRRNVPGQGPLLFNNAYLRGAAHQGSHSPTSTPCKSHVVRPTRSASPTTRSTRWARSRSGEASSSADDLTPRDPSSIHHHLANRHTPHPPNIRSHNPPATTRLCCVALLLHVGGCTRARPSSRSTRLPVFNDGAFFVLPSLTGSSTDAHQIRLEDGDRRPSVFGRPRETNVASSEPRRVPAYFVRSPTSTSPSCS